MDKLAVLKENLRSYERLCVGFSGGVDSTFLLKVARDTLGESVVAVIADGVMMPRRAFHEALALTERLGAAAETLQLDPLSVSEFARNDKMRCYHCKKYIFTAIQTKADALGIATVADGKNTDDALVYRPGQQAAQELGVVSPLFEAGLSKADIRRLSRELGLPTWDKPSNACLATRLPYDTVVTADMLHRIEQAENMLEDKGVSGMRARVHGDVLRIEAQQRDFLHIIGNDKLINGLKDLGFKYVTLDLECVRSGSMD